MDIIGAVEPGHSTTTTPFSIFMPHSNAMSPDFAGVNSITPRSFRDSARLVVSEGIVTSVRMFCRLCGGR